MSFTTASVQQFTRLALVVTLGLVAIASAKADVRYTSQQRMACMPDALRLCSDSIPDVGRIKACMIAHKSSLSAGCKAVF